MSWTALAAPVAGAIAGHALGGKDNEQTTKVEYPSWVEDYGKRIAKAGGRLADQEYTPYPYERVAGWGPGQDAAYDAAFSSAGSWAPALQRGAGLVEGALSYATPNSFQFNPLGVYGGADVTPREVTARTWDADVARQYMNPYISEALQPAIRDAQVAFSQDILGDRASAAAEGAYGGSRQAVLDAENRRRFEVGLGDMVARGHASAYDSALAAFAADADRTLRAEEGAADRALTADFRNIENLYEQEEANRRADERAWSMGEDSRWRAVQAGLNAGTFISNLGRLQSDLAGMDLDRMWDAGAREQTMRQLRLDQDYADWIEARDWDARGLRYLTEAMAGLPYGSTTTVTSPGTSGAAQGAGLGLTAASLWRDWGSRPTAPAPVPAPSWGSGNTYPSMASWGHDTGGTFA